VQSALLFLLLAVVLGAHERIVFAPEGTKRHMGIEIKDAVVLRFAQRGGIPFYEISDIAYDRDEHILYAISDKGYLYHLKIDPKKLLQTSITKRYILQNRAGKRLRHWRADAEGLALLGADNGIKGDTRLLISFEGEPPRVDMVSTTGRFMRTINLPSKLKNPKNYRHKNKSLEALTRSPKYRSLTASEYPLKKDAKRFQTIYSLGTKEWHFYASAAINSAVTEMEMMPNDDLLVLERAYSTLSPTVITLKKVYLSRCKVASVCDAKELARFSSAEGWAVDNFEGLTRIDEHLYLMISDDNNNFFQRTILVLFEVTI
jgi:hypothetical protein